MKKRELRELDEKTITAGIALATTVTTALFILYIVGKMVSTLRKLDRALGIYIKEHKYRIAEFERQEEIHENFLEDC